MKPRIITGDCREIMAHEGPFDLIIADPPYGDTALAWDKKVRGWDAVARDRLKPTGSLWVFGSMRYFLVEGLPSGFRYAQDIVWEKHNGSGFAADRFKRVHEHAVQFYRDNASWASVWNEPQREPARHARKVVKSGDLRAQTPHARKIEAKEYQDDGSRIHRSVVQMRSMQGRAIHPTEKPAALMELLIRTSCPPGGLVGDFFAGSGAAGEACALTARDYVGCEIDADMAQKARARLGGNLFGAAA